MPSTGVLIEPEPETVLLACTVATAAELPAVKVLSNSFLAKHPDAKFIALVVDAPASSTGPGLITPSDLGVEPAELAELATACTAAQLCAVLRPRLLETLLASKLPVLYLDPWIQVLDSVSDVVLAAVKRGPLVLVPRALRPLPDDGLRPEPAELLDTGVFDPGFLVVAPGAEPFLHNLAGQLRRTPDATKAVLDTAPALVNHHVLRDSTIGLSVWNANHRELNRGEDGVLTILGNPLRTVHFAGFDPRRPWLLSADFAERPRVLLSEHPLIADLCTTYRAELVTRGYTVQPVQYGFGALVDGSVLPDELRADYREASRRKAPPPAFGPDGGAAFLAWACEPMPDLPGSTRWSAAVWRADETLRAQFPDPFGDDSVDFREWCAGAGVASGRLPVPAVPGPHPLAPALLDQLGVAVLGEGPVARLVETVARASGLPTSTTAGYPVVLRAGGDEHVPADRFVVDYSLDAGAHQDRPTAHELWVPSESTRAAAERIGGPTVRVVPLPVIDTGERELTDDRGEVVFGALADHGEDRAGNVLGAVSAFLGAFPDRSDVRLLISVTGAADYPEAAERLRLATAADPRIELVEDEPVPDSVDCLITLHRGGACDRITGHVAELAVRGVPVLLSEHGAVAELFDKDSAVFVPCHQGGVEPDVQAASKLIRSIAGDRPTAVAIGLAGREHLLHTRSLARVADQLRERVEHAYRGWRARRSAANPAQAVDPLRALHSAKHALLRQPDTTSASRIPMAPALRKVVLRVLDHYDNHMREVLTTLVDGVERTASELVRRQDDIDAGVGIGELEMVRAEIDRVAERQAHLGDQLVATDDAIVRGRADLTGQARRQREIEDALVGEATKRAKQNEALGQRLDKLTHALDRTLDRIDTLESKVVEVLRDRDHRLDAGVRAASQAQSTADALRRVVVREHERHSESEPDVRSSLVLSDVGLLRLPADDAFMLPLLSSNGVWESELSELIDSLVEPDGVFLDIGAYIGYQAIRMLSRLGTSGAVVAVEPSAAAMELLRHNVEVNLPDRIGERLIMVQAAAWESAGELRGDPALTGGISVAPLEEDAPGEVTRVRAVRLDKELEEMPQLRGMKLSVVRVDAPGRGHRALAGLVRSLRKDRPHVFLEFSASATEGFGDDPVTVLKEFRMWGYDLVPVATRQPALPEQIVSAMEGLRSITLWLRPRPVQAKKPGPEVAVPLRQAADQAI
ncbi:FkbM family methyltransferase [Umezawaea sp. Da 62-37]|uniref:FkbM family methyltransferase n=1 Tax=Umezawaea sp. Da 62-37 TaxID=3075927 RepID=UPI0028F74BD5|nr:FkbM family methyltransferase [Umezawaea sp. Da 62-37]WNV82554.1 FkbM family methyltransferase [Umezawaea sp. Da 62-37]